MHVDDVIACVFCVQNLKKYASTIFTVRHQVNNFKPTKILAVLCLSEPLYLSIQSSFYLYPTDSKIAMIAIACQRVSSVLLHDVLLTKGDYFCNNENGRLLGLINQTYAAHKLLFPKRLE